MQPISRPSVTYERLREVLNYCPETGEWTWLISPAKPVPTGSKAGTISKYGYLVIQIGGRVYKAHRLAFLYMTEKWPVAQVDHKDTVRENCRWDNLREATQSQNSANANLQSNNTSGFKGVIFSKRKGRAGRWVARITKDQRKKYIGQFKTPEEAHEAYRLAAQKTFGEFARP